MDSRAIDEIGNYTCFECCDTLEEAKESAPDYGNGCCIWSCDVKGNELINEKFITKLK